jgi:flavin reductase (DIM6/NTAB) family NADH-FMN oxidoreductase RutF
MTVDAKTLRKAMRAWATGVTIVTAAHDGSQHGMTVSSFTSLSLEPPLVLVSLEGDTRTHALVQASEHFAVTVLSGDQQDASNRFANSRTDAEYRFADLATHTMTSGAPLLSNGLAFFDCKVINKYQAGTHTVFIGEVLAAESADAIGAPLLYFNQGYQELK